MKPSVVSEVEMMWKISFFLFICFNYVQYSEGYISYFSCEFQNESTCSVQNITPIIIEYQSIHISGQEGNYANSSITKLTFDSPNVVNFIPSTIFRIFPNLQALEMNNVSMTNLTTDSFIHCNNLTTISIMFNNFNRIPSKFANRCHNIDRISFNHNQITIIDEDAFNGLNNLKVLDLSFNKISCIPSKLFESSLNIEEISFKNNEIIAVDKYLFGKLQTVQVINLDENKITFIPVMSFHETAMKNALNLIINNNPIYAIEPTFIEKFFSVESLHSSINFTMSETENICIPKELEFPVIQQANYKFANDALSNCYANWSSDMLQIENLCHSSESKSSSNLMQLLKQDINTCKVTAVCRYYVDHLKQYTCVIEQIGSTTSYISGNHISEIFSDNDVVNVFIANSVLNTIPSVIFEKFPNLTFLTISNSTMTFIHERTLTKCENLKYLDVSDNNIMHISKYAFKMCSNLQIIDLSENPIEYLDIQYVRRLKRIYLNKKSLFG